MHTYNKIVPNLLSVSARSETSRRASVSEYGLRLSFINGLKILSRKPLRV